MIQRHDARVRHYGWAIQRKLDFIVNIKMLASGVYNLQKIGIQFIAYVWICLSEIDCHL